MGGINMHYTQRLKDLREDKDLTQENLAKKLNMKREQYRRYETGINEIKASHIIMFAKFYNVSADYILGLTNEPTNKWNIKNQNNIMNNYGNIEIK